MRTRFARTLSAIVSMVLLITATPGAYALDLTPAVPDFTDTADSPFRAEIEWLAETGATRGCAPDRFCPDDTITRGQAAAILNRLLDLVPSPGEKRFIENVVPSPGEKRFIDTVRHPFAADIDAVAAAGIMRGCGPNKFCPDEPLTRLQTAIILKRLYPWAIGTHTLASIRLDDLPIEADPDGAARTMMLRGISRGCGEFLFCPDRPITRGEMAAFLYRARGHLHEWRDRHYNPPTNRHSARITIPVGWELDFHGGCGDGVLMGKEYPNRNRPAHTIEEKEHAILVAVSHNSYKSRRHFRGHNFSYYFTNTGDEPLRVGIVYECGGASREQPINYCIKPQQRTKSFELGGFVCT